MYQIILRDSAGVGHIGWRRDHTESVCGLDARNMEWITVVYWELGETRPAVPCTGCTWYAYEMDRFHDAWGDVA